jgi:tripartite-type tricarboxylate transporter receptor subunit TctC
MRLYNLKALALVATLGAALALVAACGSEDPDVGTDPGPTPTPVEVGNGAPAPTPTDDPPGTSPADSDFDAEAYFRGQTIRMVTSSAPGGDTDITMRYFASQWGRYFPGNPRIVASNISPHLAGNNFLFRAEPDGLTIGLWSHNPTRQQFWDGSEYNATEFVYIGDINPSNTVILVRSELGYERITDAMGQTAPEIVQGVRAPSPQDLESSTLGDMLIAEYLDVPFVFRTVAESGSAQQLIDVERGNVDVLRGSARWFAMPNLRPGWISDGFLVPFVDVTPFDRMLPNDEFSDVESVPHIEDLFTEEQMSIYNGVVNSATGTGKPLILPPNTPAHLVAVYGQAFYDAMHDESFTTDLVRVSGAPVRYRSGEAVQNLIAEASRTQVEYEADAERLAEELYPKYFR